MTKQAQSTVVNDSLVKAYQHLDSETGEVKSKYKYLAGRPKQYRFNGQTGQFNLNGTEYIGTSLSIQPLTWRIFEENLFAEVAKKSGQRFSLLIAPMPFQPLCSATRPWDDYSN